ncbi:MULTISPECIES: 2-phosphosulfolactate phosphatase [Persicobacter]|nr:2-phosphosulfolactate phosphatase [Persicobacter sp. CCB-QB2]
MKKIDICLSPEMIHLYDLKGKVAVVVDVLRATTCMVTGIAKGIPSITPVAHLEECKVLQEKGYIAAAERGGAKVDGFDMGNSPYSYMEAATTGKKVAATTTNGTLAITKSADADEIIIGAFINLEAVTNYLAAQDKDVVIVAAGWKGKFNLEDSLFAGALAEALEGQFEFADDASLAMKVLYLSVKHDLLGFLAASSHAKRLAKMNIQKDIEFALTPNQYDIVPVVRNGEIVKP